MAKKNITYEIKMGAPEYMNTYGDMMTLLLCFFVLLFAMSNIDAKKFEIKEALGIVKEDLEELRKQATELRNACDNEGWFSGVTMFEDQVNYYNKQIWFIRALLG